MRINLTNRFGNKLRLLVMISGSLLVMLFCGPVYAQPANDDCENATVVPGSAPNPPYSDSVDATDATFDPADPLLSCNNGGGGDGTQTVWYKYTADESGIINVNTFGSTEAGGSELDTAHGIFVGECGALVEIACVDLGLTDELIEPVEAGTTYYVKVGQFADASDAGTIVLNVVAPPEPELYVLESVRDGMSPPISSIIPAAPVAPRGLSYKAIEVPNVMFSGWEHTSQASQAISGSAVPTRGSPLLAAFGLDDILQVFEGQSNTDNAFTLGILLAPPDTVGDVGPNHYVQMVNVITQIFDKSGNSILGPFGGNAFWSGLGGNCEFTNRGDPIVLYDEETDRWLVSQFAFPAGPGDSLCLAISTTSDPTGSYYQHEFDFTGIGFPDYPKWGFSTGAINVMANMFAPFSGTGIGAIDKSEAMSAGPTTMVFFILGAAEFGFIPGDNDGPVFDNTLPTFFTNNSTSGNAIDVWEVYPDWVTPADSAVAEVASIPVAPFDSTLCNAPRGACIDQPGSGTGSFPNNIPFLEGIADRLMHRAQMRDFGKRKIAMVSHTVDADGSGKAGVRWYEFWNSKDNGWQLKKQNTYSPDGDHRWMGSIAMNAAGQTCLGYSISSQTTYPSIGVAGRNGTSNHMNVAEMVVFDGNVAGNVQRRTARWGDYSSMSIDPVDDSCWYTQEYALPNPFIGEQFGWGTKVIQFTVPDDDD